jgi:hypothetical protein
MIDKPGRSRSRNKKTQWGDKDTFSNSQKKAGKRQKILIEDDNWQEEAQAAMRHDVRDSLDAG